MESRYLLGMLDLVCSWSRCHSLVPLLWWVSVAVAASRICLFVWEAYYSMSPCGAGGRPAIPQTIQAFPACASNFWHVLWMVMAASRIKDSYSSCSQLIRGVRFVLAYWGNIR